MTHCVYRYPIGIVDHQEVSLPTGAQILTVARRGDAHLVVDGVPRESAELWALVDPSAPPAARRLRIAGTGHPIVAPESLRYIGTILLHSGVLVFHVFEEVGTD